MQAAAALQDWSHCGAAVGPDPLAAGGSEEPTARLRTHGLAQDPRLCWWCDGSAPLAWLLQTKGAAPWLNAGAVYRGAA